MPIYQLRCPTCEHRWEDVAPASRRIEIPCPTCGCCPVETDFTTWVGKRLPTAERRFTEREGTSLRFGFHEDEVAEARRELPNTRITDQGDVVFEGTGSIKVFERDVERMREREARAAQEESAAREKLSQIVPNLSGAVDEVTVNL